MGIFKDVLEGFVGGFTLATVDIVRSNRSMGLGTTQVERLCREIGWGVDERSRDGITLYFTDPILHIRKLMLTEGNHLVLFSTLSAATLPGSRVPAELLGYLLGRNAQLATCAWQAAATDRGTVAFSLTYCALISGLDAVAFKSIIEVMVPEVQSFDGKMRGAGLL